MQLSQEVKLFYMAFVKTSSADFIRSICISLQLCDESDCRFGDSFHVSPPFPTTTLWSTIKSNLCAWGDLPPLKKHLDVGVFLIIRKGRKPVPIWNIQWIKPETKAYENRYQNCYLHLAIEKQCVGNIYLIAWENILMYV